MLIYLAALSFAVFLPFPPPTYSPIYPRVLYRLIKTPKKNPKSPKTKKKHWAGYFSNPDINY
jgi:hypothetical protein